MASPDLLFGFLISRFLSRPEARSPAVTFPPAPGSPATTPAPSSPAAPTVPASLPAPSFPAQVPIPPAAQPQQQAPAGFKRAIEIWQVNPTLIRQAGTALVGAPEEVIGAAAAITLQALEQRFPSGWVSLRRAPTAAESQQAKALLAQWRDGGVVFMGPATLQGRLAYRMTKHPAATPAQAAPPAPTAPLPSTASFPTVPASAPATPPAAAPAAAPAASPGPTTLPEVLITADTPKPTPAPSTPAPTAPVTQITTVRRGEGLANVAKRLGRPATQQSALELRAANVPGPDGNFSSQDLSKGGLKKTGRAGGLQPGDRLFVPPSWGVVDAARL